MCLQQKEEGILWLSGPAMVVIRRVWWSETRLEFETWRAASERDAEVAAWDFTTYTEGKKKKQTMCFFVPMTLFLKCLRLCSWQGWSAFYLGNWGQLPRPCPGLDCWTWCKQLPSCPEGKWRQGSMTGWKEKCQSQKLHRFTEANLFLKRRVVISSLQTSTQDFLDFPPQFQRLIRGHRKSSVSLQLWLY